VSGVVELGAHKGPDCVVVEPTVCSVTLFVVCEKKWVECNVVSVHHGEHESWRATAVVHDSFECLQFPLA